MAAPHVHGPGRIAAAATAAPAAAFLLTLALCGLLPAGGDVRLVVFLLVGLPAIAAAPCLALLARSGRRAWAGAGAAGLLAAALLVLP